MMTIVAERIELAEAWEWFSFVPRNRNPYYGVEDAEVRCRECTEWSPGLEWQDCEPYCEECGSHAGVMCPRCGEQFDHCFAASTPFEIRRLTASVS